jgi:hypothetical protein
MRTINTFEDTHVSMKPSLGGSVEEGVEREQPARALVEEPSFVALWVYVQASC